MKTTLIAGQASWRFNSDKVRAAVTETGGQLAPVSFELESRRVEPFSVAPWATEKVAPELPAMLRALRGDFFCAPFGGNDKAYRGEAHPPHGESANAKWTFEGLEKRDGTIRLHLSLKTTIRAGKINKQIELKPGHTALYCRHVLSGMTGPINLGHHAMLKFASEGNLSSSRIRFGQVFPGQFEDPAQGGYNSLKRGALFSRLDRVPLAEGGTADLSHYPARRGFEDLVMMTHEDRPDFAWTAVAFPEEGYAWYALKDPRTLQSTVLWHSNGGRHYAPWNGRHAGVLGIEDVTAYFHYGLKESAGPNPVNRRGIATVLKLSARQPLMVNYIMSVAAIPKDFLRVKTIRPSTQGVTLLSTSGQKVAAPLDLTFLKS